MSYSIPDDPIIANLMRTGYPDGRAPMYPRCPVCGDECETIYADRAGEIVGCDCCVTTKDAWETDDCFPARY